MNNQKTDWNWIVLQGVDISGRTSFNTIFWDKVITEKNDSISLKFDNWVLSNQLTSTSANWWTATETNSRLFLQTSTATNWSIIIQSKDVVRYRPWHDIYAYFTYAWVNGWVAGCKQYIWIMNNANGYYIGFNGVNFVVWRRKAWIDNEQLRSAFFDRLDGTSDSEFNIDFTKINIFRISFWYLWIAPAVFEIYWGAENWWIKFAVIDIVNTSQELTIETPNLPIRMELIKTSWATNITWYSWSCSGWFYNWWNWLNYIWNIPNSYNTWLWITITPVSANDIMAVVTFRLKTTFNTKTNTVTAKLVSSNFTNDSSWNIILWQIVANPTTVWWVAVWSLTYTDINTTNSMIEYSNGAWIVVWWTVLFSEYMVWNWIGWTATKGTSEINADNLWLLWRPWDIFTITYRRVSWSGAYKALLNMNWIELF